MAYSQVIDSVNTTVRNDSIVLVCAADNNYAMPLAVMVRSVIDNLGDGRHLHVCIIDGGIAKPNKRKITESLDSDRLTITWLQLDNKLLEGLESHWYITTSMFYRLFIPQLLVNYKKAIYLDTDLVVNKDIGQLWDIDLGENYVLAVQELYPSLINQKLPSDKGFPKEQVDNLFISSDDTFKAFNSGVLVLNLEKWRANNVGQNIVRYLVEYKPYGRTTDGDGLNIWLRNKWGVLNPRWNQTPGIFEYKSWKESPFSQEEFDNLLNDPYIIHWAHPGKPWNTRGRHPAEDLFYYYLDMTAWSGWRFTIWKRIWRKLSREVDAIFKRLLTKLNKQHHQNPSQHCGY